MNDDQQSQNLILLNANLKDCLIKQIFSYPHYLVLSLHGQGHNSYLYIARGKNKPTLLFDYKKIEKLPRVDDKYVHILRSFLKGQYITDLCIDDLHGMLRICGHKGRSSSSLCLYYKDDGVYFSLLLRAQDFSKSFASWDGRLCEFSTEDGAVESAFSVPKGKSLKLSLAMSNVSYLEMWAKLQKQFANKKEQKISHKKNKIEGDLIRLNAAIARIEKDLKENFAFDEIYECAGYKIKFRRGETQWKKKEAVYNKLKALKKGCGIQKKRLDELVHREAISMPSPVKALNPIWRSAPDPRQKSTIVEGSHNVRDLKTNKNALVKVGINDSGNDFLLTNWSKANDLWVHLHDYPSGHAIIRFVDAKRDQLFELLDEVAILLKELSGLTGERISLVYTERRWVKPIKGTKGKVKLSKFHIYLPHQ